MVMTPDEERLKSFITRDFIGESVQWVGRPGVAGKVLVSFGIWLFAIPWTAFALFWESMVLLPVLGDLFGYEVGGSAGTGMRLGMAVMALFGLPFVLIGFGMLLVPLFTWWKGRREVYVLSNRRLALLEAGGTMRIRSIPLEDIGEITRKERADGSGTLELSLGYERDSDGDRVRRSETLGLIPDVRAVERLLVELRDRQRRG
jgi:hypothetical protein